MYDPLNLAVVIDDENPSLLLNVHPERMALILGAPESLRTPEKGHDTPPFTFNVTTGLAL